MSPLATDTRTELWDCHLHVFRKTKSYAQASYVPPALDIHDFAHEAKRHGITHAVLVHASVDGDDVSEVLAALQTDTPLQLCAVLGVQSCARDVQRLHALGVRAIRLQDRSRLGASQLALLSDQAALAAQVNWHLELNTIPASFAYLRAALPNLPRGLRLVLDHVGHVHPDRREEQQQLFQLMDSGQVMVKLSLTRLLAYNLNNRYECLTSWVQALVSRFPDQCVWGSDWPHVMTDGPRPEIAEMLAYLRETLSADEWHRCMQTNPAALYVQR